MDDDGEVMSDSKRRTRNLSEKKRRDQFNMLLNELSTMVSTNNKKMDKSTVLNSTIAFLRNHNEVTVRSRLNDVQKDWKPSFLSNEEFTHLVLEALEGFLIVFSATGRIYYVSDNVTSLLGHVPSDIVNKSLFDLSQDDDRPYLYNLLQSPCKSGDTMQSVVIKENQINFRCHIRRGTSEAEEEFTYELVQFKGHYRSSVNELEIEELPGFTQENKSSILFVCTGRLYTAQLIRDASLIDISKSEFTSRHSLEWKFLFLDHRAPPIIGYLPFEVLGTSGYDYYHFDDLEKLTACHEALMQKGEITSCYYRFLTKGQQWIWLQTRFYITYHQWNSKPEFVVCTHKVVSYTDIVKGIKREEFVEKVEVQEVQETVAPIVEPESSDAGHAPGEGSPSYLSETSEAYSSKYLPPSKTASVKSGGSTTATVNTGGASWSRVARVRYESDTTSVSEDSRRSSRIKRPRKPEPQRPQMITPQHAIGSQYLQPAPYVATMGPVAVPFAMPVASTALPLALPVHNTPSLQNLQDSLQRKHEELQQMIIQQQEELRRVSEQLVMARLGLIPPVISVYPAASTSATLDFNQTLPQLIYDTGIGPPTLTSLPALPGLPALAAYPANSQPPHPSHLQ